MKHTPGPWVCLSTIIDKKTVVMVGKDSPEEGTNRLSDEYAVALIPIVTDESEANAHLIAAAPELLEALDPDTLEAIADEIDCFEHSARSHVLRSIAKEQRAAIKKALGDD